MSTMHLSPNSSKETIIKASNQVLKLSSLRALVIRWNSMPTILMLWLPKLLNISTCSMYWAEKASRLKTQLQFIYPWYDLQLQIVVQYGTTPLPLTTLKRYNVYRNSPSRSSYLHFHTKKLSNVYNYPH